MLKTACSLVLTLVVSFTLRGQTDTRWRARKDRRQCSETGGSVGSFGSGLIGSVCQVTKGCTHGSRLCLIIPLVVVVYLTFVAPGIAQQRSDPMAATVSQWFTMIEQSFVSLADAMPAEKYGFKPTNGAFMGARTFGEQVKHVACGNFAFFNEIEKKEPPPGCATGGPSPAKTKAEVMTYLRESFEYAQGVLRTMTQANALDPASGPYGGTSTRLGLTTLAVWHASDHYGQLVVYLRMNGIAPPASQPARSR